MNATPLDENLLAQTPPANHKKYGMIIGVVAVFALVLGVVGYALKSQVTTTQTTDTNARIPRDQCLPPGILVQCKDGGYECADPNIPGSTFDVCGDGCKRVNPCVLKCRNAQGLEQFINECEQPSPTPPQKTPDVSCPAPQVVSNVTISCPKCAQ